MIRQPVPFRAADLYPRRRRGLIVIELLMLIAVVAVTVGQLLPAAQLRREAAARDSCSHAVRQIGRGVGMYMDDRRRLPGPISDGNPFWTDLIDKGGWEMEDGEWVRLEGELHLVLGRETLLGHGYHISYAEEGDGFRLVAAPVLSGITAGETLVLTSGTGTPPDQLTASPFPTPGADENRAAAFAAIRQCALQLSGELLLEKGNPETARSVKPFLSRAGTVRDVFSVIDRDRNGEVTFAEIGSSIPEGLADCVRAELWLGSGGVDVDGLPGVALDDEALPGDPADLFSFEEICLTTVLVTEDEGIASALCAKLAGAQRAEERRTLKSRDNILRACQNQIAAQSGRSISPEASRILHYLAEVLKAAE